MCGDGFDQQGQSWYDRTQQVLSLFDYVDYHYTQVQIEQVIILQVSISLIVCRDTSMQRRSVVLIHWTTFGANGCNWRGPRR